MNRSKQRGQSMLEYAVVCAAMVTALFFVDTSKGMPVAFYLIDMIKAFFRSLTHFISLP
jgi:hypothetical protein